MGKDAKNITAAVKTIRKVYQEISKLLLTADTIMSEKGWEAAYGSNAIGSSSKDIKNPGDWMPYNIFRFYKSKDNPRTLMCINVMMDDYEYPEEFDESFISGLIFIYEKPVEDNWKFEYSRYHFWANDAKEEVLTGKFCEITPRKTWPDEEHPFDRFYSFGLPLDEINSTEELKKNIIKPLFSKVT